MGSFGLNSRVCLAAFMFSSNAISSIERDLAFKSKINDFDETRFVK